MVALLSALAVVVVSAFATQESPHLLHNRLPRVGGLPKLHGLRLTLMLWPGLAIGASRLSPIFPEVLLAIGSSALYVHQEEAPYSSPVVSRSRKPRPSNPKELPSLARLFPPPPPTIFPLSPPNSQPTTFPPPRPNHILATTTQQSTFSAGPQTHRSPNISRYPLNDLHTHHQPITWPPYDLHNHHQPITWPPYDLHTYHQPIT